jgi:O-antigen ligase
MRKVAFYLSLILIFTIPWEDAITLRGVASISRYIGILTAAIWLISLFFTGKIRKPTTYHLLVILFMLWNFASLIWTVALTETLQEILTYVQLIILIWIIWDLYTSIESVYRAMNAFIFGAYVAIFATINNYIHGHEIEVYSGGRYAGVGNAVDLALILTIGLPIAWYLAISSHQSKKLLIKIINFAYIPLALFSILLTGTRMAIFAVIPAVVYVLSTFNRAKPILKITSVVAVIGSMFIVEPLIPRSTLDRLQTAFSSISAGDLGGRIPLWQQSLAYFSASPIIGIGSGALNSSIMLGTVAHNTFISVLTELGIFGFILFIFILFYVLYAAIIQKNDLSKLWISVLSIWVIGVSTLTWEYRKVTWLILTLIIVSNTYSHKKYIAVI